MKRNYINLVADMGEISGLIAGSTDLQTFLNRMVEMVARHLESDVCSVYLHMDASDDLELKATVGLNPNAVGKVRLRQGEGLVGTCLKELHPIIERNASRNPAYKYFPETNDVEDLANRIINNLMHLSGKSMEVFSDRIIVARNLFPSDLIKFAFEDVRGIILAGGGLTTHISIIARSLQIPLILVSSNDLLSLLNGTMLVLDGETGNIHIAPTAEMIEKFDRRNIAQDLTHNNSRHEFMHETTCTKDGTRIKLQANINLLSEIDTASKLKAEGIGLYRSEFPFLIRSFFPTEEEQYSVYKTLFAKLKTKDIIIRTLDIGGEKTPSYHDNASEVNPELGLRSIRFSLKHPDIFETQIRAILMAGAGREYVNIMFPMIVSLDEFRKAKSIVLSCQNELKRKDIPCVQNLRIGIMIEVPALVSLMDDFIYESDFFSIGTNDFVQYMLAVDRGNEKVASYYCPHHPAVLRGLASIVKTASRADRPVTICGEMAHQIQYLPFLIGIGIRQLSLDPHCLPEVQRCIQTLTLSECKHLSEQVLNESSIEHIEHVLNEFQRKPESISLQSVPEP